MYVLKIWMGGKLEEKNGGGRTGHTQKPDLPVL